MTELLQWEKVENTEGLFKGIFYKSKLARANFMGNLNTDIRYEISTIPGISEYKVFLLNSAGDFLEIGYYFDFESASEFANQHYLGQCIAGPDFIST